MKNMPLRMCIVCREMKDRRQLMRIVKDAEGNLFIDKTQKSNGRGAYICDSPECLDKAIKTKALNRSFSMNVPKEIYEKIKGEKY